MIDRGTHNKEEKTVEGYLTVGSTHIECVFYYQGKGIKTEVIKAYATNSGMVENDCILRFFNYNKDVFAEIEDEISVMLEDESSEYDEVAQPSYGYHGSVVE